MHLITSTWKQLTRGATIGVGRHWPPLTRLPYVGNNFNKCKHMREEDTLQ